MTTTHVSRLEPDPARAARLALAGPAAAAAGRPDRRGVPLGAGRRLLERPAARHPAPRLSSRGPATSPSTGSTRSPSPAPVTTIAWRIAHLVVGVLRRPQRLPLRRPAGGLPDVGVRRHGGRSRWTSSTPPTPPGSPVSAASARTALARAVRSGGGAVRRGARSPGWCCTSTARRSTTAPRSPCSATSTPTATDPRERTPHARHAPALRHRARRAASPTSPSSSTPSGPSPTASPTSRPGRRRRRARCRSARWSSTPPRSRRAGSPG